MEAIKEFDGKYAFLSNFYESPVIFQGVEYPTAEHAFQAAKCSSTVEREAIRRAPTPGKAKRLGRHCDLIPDWEDVKRTVMTNIVWSKFNESIDLKTKLLATGNALLVEGNTWHDNTWGNCTCDRCRDQEGLNWLGEILMEVRESIRGQMTFQANAKV